MQNKITDYRSGNRLLARNNMINYVFTFGIVNIFDEYKQLFFDYHEICCSNKNDLEISIIINRFDIENERFSF